MRPTSRLRIPVGVLAGVVALAVGGWLVVLATRTFPTDPDGGPDALAAATVAMPTSAAADPVMTAPPVTTAPDPATAPDPVTVSAPAPDPDWVARIGARTGIPPRAVQAYAAAQLWISRAAPTCRLTWTTLAAIGYVESDHGRHGGAAIGGDGEVRPRIVGPVLDGTAGNLAIADTDGGVLDGDTTADRAVGPMQFIPEAWREWGTSLRGGSPDPDDIDDAAVTAARYLCASGGDLRTAAGWRAAVGSYNAPDVYAADVLAVADTYARRSLP